MRKTAKKGLPINSSERKGLVKCGDPVLEERLKKRSKTQLHPPRLRRNPDPKAAKKWLAKVGKNIKTNIRRKQSYRIV